MFQLSALSLFVAFLATSALPQDHSSEQSEAQIAGAHRLFLTHTPNPLPVSPSHDCRRSQSRVHAILLRSRGPGHFRVPHDMDARDTARERHRGPGPVGQHLG